MTARQPSSSSRATSGIPKMRCHQAAVASQSRTEKEMWDTPANAGGEANRGTEPVRSHVASFRFTSSDTVDDILRIGVYQDPSQRDPWPREAEPLTTTSYAILSLLAVQPWTAYGLAQQMERSLERMWPRAASVVYAEPKRLVRHGLADARREYTGRRPSTVYSITDEGREALATWLSEPGSGPVAECEALLKVAFADHGTLADLRTNLAAIRTWAEADLAEGRARHVEYAETGGPFPDRLPAIALAARYYAEVSSAVLRWAQWAEDATAAWSGVTVETGATVPDDAFHLSGD